MKIYISFLFIYTKYPVYGLCVSLAKQEDSEI